MVPFSYANKDFEKDDLIVDTDISKLKDKVEIQKNVRKFLNDYFQSTCLKGIKFESTFSKEYRKLIHKIANNIGLKNQSIGNVQNKYLTIGKKTSPHDRPILERFVANSGQNGKYKLLKKGLILIYCDLFRF
jgi:hypothetical protein